MNRRALLFFSSLVEKRSRENAGEANIRAHQTRRNFANAANSRRLTQFALDWHLKGLLRFGSARSSCYVSVFGTRSAPASMGLLTSRRIRDIPPRAGAKNIAAEVWNSSDAIGAGRSRDAIILGARSPAILTTVGRGTKGRRKTLQRYHFGANADCSEVVD